MSRVRRDNGNSIDRLAGESRLAAKNGIGIEDIW
jgi:hypothetical protein